MRPAARDIVLCLCIPAVIDLTWAIADVSRFLTAVEIAHAFKGGKRDPDDIQSFRPLGIAEPLLSIVVDFLHLRTAYRVNHFVGSLQLGGRADPRCHIVRFESAAAARKSLGLPYVDNHGDARFGYDGGRHAQILLQLHRAGCDPRDVLIFAAILSKHALLIRVTNASGTVALLEPIQLIGGGMVQGLSMREQPRLHTSPVHLQDEILSSVPTACTCASPPLLEAFLATKTDDVHRNMNLCTHNVRLRVWRIQSALELSGNVWSASARAAAFAAMEVCESDAERLLILDWMRPASCLFWLFIQMTLPAALLHQQLVWSSPKQ